jgi:uncharacterized repeat protein (TIGR04138 family)
VGPDTVIEQNLPCTGCGYNLRGLTVVHRCPECERPALRAYVISQSAIAGVTRTGGERALVDERRAFGILAALLGCDANAVRFVRTSASLASRANGGRADAADYVSATALCQAVRTLAVTHFGSAAGALTGLRELGLSRGEDVGRIVAALVEAGFLHPAPESSRSEFNGLFTLDTLFDLH